MATDVISASRTTALLKTHGGPGLVLYAPLGTTFPTDIGDVITLAHGATQWEPKSPWTSLGITKGGVNIQRGFDQKIDREGDQTYGKYDIRPTSWAAMVSTELLESDETAMQIAWVGSGVSADASQVKTTLQAACAAGASTFTLNSVAGLSASDDLSIGTGPTQETQQYTSAAGNVVTIAGTLDYAHASGELVVRFAKSSIGFGTARSVPPRLLAVVAPTNFDDPSAGGVVQGLRMWAFRRVKLAEGLKQMAISNGADWTLPVSFHVLMDLTIKDPELDTFKVFDRQYS